MKIAANTDILSDCGSPRRVMRLLAGAGFTHLHWCHHWSDDFIYGKYELAELKKYLKEYNLTLLDIHGSAEREKCWSSILEYERKSGVELVVNRIEMLRELSGTGVLMMHVPSLISGSNPGDEEMVSKRLDALRRSLDELMPVLERHDALIAIENMWLDTWNTLEALFAEYPKERLGLCYDSGHANSSPALDRLESNKGRLEALHLHDNDGRSDLHQPPFYGSIDWAKLARIIASSSYRREISYEISIRNTPFFVAGNNPDQLSDETVAAFLKEAYDRCFRFALMAEKARAAN